MPDTFHLLAEYAKGHSLVLSSSMANDTHIPGLIRGHEGTIIMVDHGKFERNVPFITVKPQVIGGRMVDGKRRGESIGGDAYETKFGTEGYPDPHRPADMMNVHIGNFLECMRTREKPHLDVETGARRWW